MTTFIGTLPAGVEILAMATSATCIVIATSDGPYIVQNDKLEKLQPFDVEVWRKGTREYSIGERSHG